MKKTIAKVSALLLTGTMLAACSSPQSEPATTVSAHEESVTGESSGEKTSEVHTAMAESEENMTTSAAKDIIPLLDRNDPIKRSYYVHDPTAFVLKSRYNPQAENFIKDEHFIAAVDEAVDGGADVFISEIYGMVPWYPSEVYPIEQHLEWFKETFGKSGVSEWSVYVKNGGDFVKISCDEAHKKGAEYWLSYRINDHHSFETGVTLDPDSITNPVFAGARVSKFYIEHLDELIGEKQFHSWDPYLLDFQYDNVRTYKLSIISELIDNYDIDGIMLDFLRDPALFNQETTTTEQRKTILLDFLKSIRKMLDAKTEITGQNYYFGVKLPLNVTNYDKMGVDVAAFEQEAGVNVFFVFDGSQTVQDYKALDYVLQNTSKALVNIEMSQNVSTAAAGKLSFRGTTKEEHCTTAYVAYQRGATGASLFNFPFYRKAVEFGGVGYEPPFDIMSYLKDEELLAVQPQHYFSRLFRQWNPGNDYTYEWECAAPAGGWAENGLLRLESFDTDISDLDFEVAVNGVVLEKMVTESEPYENPYKNLLGTPSKWLSYSVPRECLKEGTNEIVVTNHSEKEVTLHFMDLAIQ